MSTIEPQPALPFGSIRAQHAVAAVTAGPSAESQGFVPLRSLIPSIKVSTQKLKKLQAIQLVRQQRDGHKQDLAFNARPFILCGIPLRRPPIDQFTYTRRNGNFFLSITAHPEFGLPYGQDRLLPIWIATLAVRQQSAVVHFEHLSEMLDYFALPMTGFYYKRIAEAFQRLFGATIFFGTEEHPSQRTVLDWARFHFFDRVKLWCSREEVLGQEATVNQGFENVITLSPAFYDEIQQHKIPVERRVVAALSNAPGPLDLYTWLAWRTWSAKGPARIPLFGPGGLHQQLGVTGYSRNRAFREKVAQWLREVRQLWPQCPARFSEDGQHLLIQPAHRSPAVLPLAAKGFSDGLLRGSGRKV